MPDSNNDSKETQNYVSEAKKIVEIKDVDVSALVSLLNSALATEFLASYQYKIVVGSMYGFERVNTEKEFLDHSKEEEEHAQMLIKRIIELQGTPLLTPYVWQEKAKQVNIDYMYPSKLDTYSLILQNIEAERQAIALYDKILDTVRGVDSITYKIVRNILEDEVEHEQDLMDLAKDIEHIQKVIKE